MDTPGHNELLKKLEFEIISGALSPRTKLNETQLATRFGVSRTPIKEALLQLKAAGLVEIQPRKGAQVAELSLKKILEMFELMGFYEAMCARLAARRSHSDDVTNIRLDHKKSIDPANKGNVNRYFLANVEFHEAIYKASRNTFLATQASELNKRLTIYRRAQLNCANRITESLHEHQLIIDAIESEDADLAAHLAATHVVEQGGNFSDFIASIDL